MPLFRSPRVRSGLRHLRFVWRHEKRQTGVYSNRGILKQGYTQWGGRGQNCFCVHGIARFELTPHYSPW